MCEKKRVDVIHSPVSNFVSALIAYFWLIRGIVFIYLVTDVAKSPDRYSSAKRSLTGGGGRQVVKFHGGREL